MSSFIGCTASLEQAKTVIFGAPFDSTASFRPGSRFAPSAIREDSYGLETYSPYQDAHLEDFPIHDAGDLEIPFGGAARSNSLIYEFASSISSAGKLPFMLGGEHSVSVGAVRAVYESNPELILVHFDAHTDLRDEYLGEPLSHACVIRRIWDFLGDDRIYQFGIRSGESEEFCFAANHTKMTRFTLDNIARLPDAPIYITLDLDVLDPAFMPGTGTPEPGGVTFTQLLDALLTLRGRRIVGVDITELSPHYDASGASTAAACKLARELLIMANARKSLP